MHGQIGRDSAVTYLMKVLVRSAPRKQQAETVDQESLAPRSIREYHLAQRTLGLHC